MVYSFLLLVEHQLSRPAEGASVKSLEFVQIKPVINLNESDFFVKAVYHIKRLQSDSGLTSPEHMICYTMQKRTILTY